MTNSAIANNVALANKTQSPLIQLFRIGGRVFLVECFDEWSGEAVAKQVSSWFLSTPEPNETAIDSTIRVRCGVVPPPIPPGLDCFDVSDGGVCHINGKAVYIELDGSLIAINTQTSPGIDVWISRQYDLSSWTLSQLLSQAFCAAMRRCGLFPLHSAGAVPPDGDKALLIVGASGGGKSTLTSQLAAAGWGYLSDDSILLKNVGPALKAEGLRKVFALTEQTIAAIQVEVGSNGSNGNKKRLAPEEFFPTGRIEARAVGAVVFPVITNTPNSRLQRLAPYEVMSRLLKHCPWACYDKPTAAAYLAVFGQLVRETTAFDLFAGRDLLGKPKFTADLMSLAFADS